MSLCAPCALCSPAVLPGTAQPGPAVHRPSRGPAGPAALPAFASASPASQPPPPKAHFTSETEARPPGRPGRGATSAGSGTSSEQVLGWKRGGGGWKRGDSEGSIYCSSRASPFGCPPVSLSPPLPAAGGPSAAAGRLPGPPTPRGRALTRLRGPSITSMDGGGCGHMGAGAARSPLPVPPAPTALPPAPPPPPRPRPAACKHCARFRPARAAASRESPRAARDSGGGVVGATGTARGPARTVPPLAWSGLCWPCRPRPGPAARGPPSGRPALATTAPAKSALAAEQAWRAAGAVLSVPGEGAVTALRGSSLQCVRVGDRACT